MKMTKIGAWDTLRYYISYRYNNDSSLGWRTPIIFFVDKSSKKRRDGKVNLKDIEHTKLTYHLNCQAGDTKSACGDMRYQEATPADLVIESVNKISDVMSEHLRFEKKLKTSDKDTIERIHHYMIELDNIKALIRKHYKEGDYQDGN